MGHYIADPEIKEIADDLIANYHPELATAEIAYVFKDKASNKDIESGQMCSASKVSGKYKPVTGDKDFIIEIAADMWLEADSTDRRIGIDSALTSCSLKIEDDGNTKTDKEGNPCWYIKPFDLQEHYEIVKRYGLDVMAEAATRRREAAAAEETTEEED